MPLLINGFAMLGLRNEIRMLSELRVKVQQAADSAWNDICEQAGGSSPEELRRIRTERYPAFQILIEYDNKQFQEELIPSYHQMAKLFRECYWLAEPDTRAYYSELIEFVGLWDRWLKESIPPEVITSLRLSEEKLQPFYDHLEKRHDSLRKKIKAAKP
jgi:hypothetical protein